MKSEVALEGNLSLANLLVELGELDDAESETVKELQERPENPEALSLLAKIKHIPVILVQGDQDKLVKVDGARRWAAEMKKEGMTYEYIEVPGGTHSSAGRQNIDKVFAFLERQRKR